MQHPHTAHTPSFPIGRFFHVISHEILLSSLRFEVFPGHGSHGKSSKSWLLKTHGFPCFFPYVSINGLICRRESQQLSGLVFSTFPKSGAFLQVLPCKNPNVLQYDQYAGPPYPVPSYSGSAGPLGHDLRMFPSHRLPPRPRTSQVLSSRDWSVQRPLTYLGAVKSKRQWKAQPKGAKLTQTCTEMDNWIENIS